jgi:hypothetical protein
MLVTFSKSSAGTLMVHLRRKMFYIYEEKHRSEEKNVLNHFILYVHSVTLLIWSSTQLNFPFYDFSVTYYDFSKLL